MIVYRAPPKAFLPRLASGRNCSSPNAYFSYDSYASTIAARTASRRATSARAQRTAAAVRNRARRRVVAGGARRRVAPRRAGLRPQVPAPEVRVTGARAAQAGRVHSRTPSTSRRRREAPRACLRRRHPRRRGGGGGGGGRGASHHASLRRPRVGVDAARALGVRGGRREARRACVTARGRRARLAQHLVLLVQHEQERPRGASDDRQEDVPAGSATRRLRRAVGSGGRRLGAEQRR